jgi:predicted Fe-S protein YdhL (DUF1289 family)
MIKSPCIRQCCLDDSDICVGCFRHINEITGWQKLSEQEQGVIVSRCDNKRKDQLLDTGSETSPEIDQA